MQQHLSYVELWGLVRFVSVPWPNEMKIVIKMAVAIVSGRKREEQHFIGELIPLSYNVFEQELPAQR